MDPITDELARSVEAQVRRSLARNDRMRALEQCRAGLNCGGVGAHGVVCLIERLPSGAPEIRDAMQKAVRGEMIIHWARPGDAPQTNSPPTENNAPELICPMTQPVVVSPAVGAPASNFD